MDGFSYNNIFDTKGIEYLVVIAFLIVIILWWQLMKANSIRPKKMQKTSGALSFSTLKIPLGLFYSKNHTWLFMQKSGIAKVGLNDLLVHLTGIKKVIPLKESGEQVSKGDVLARIGNNGKSINILSPISGTVIKPNPALEMDADTLNDDPYGKGWIYSIRPANWKGETATCYHADESPDWLRAELERFKEFISMNINKYAKDGSAVILQDGGELCDYTLSGLPEECWSDFGKNFCTL